MTTTGRWGTDSLEVLHDKNISISNPIRAQRGWKITNTVILPLAFGWRRSQVVTFTAFRLQGPRFKPWPGHKFEEKKFCFRSTPAVVKACSVRPIKTPLGKT